MKNFEKIVPVLASGLVVAGLGTADAFAAENDNIPHESAAPAEVQKQKTPEPSTEIQSFTTTDMEVTSDGRMQNTGFINFNVDSKGNATDDGSMTLTTIPDSVTPRAAAPAPTNTDVTIENTDITPDDSGTTIGSADEIKGENGKEGTTETENSDGSTTIEIDGTVTPAPSTPTDADKTNVENNVSEIVDKNKNSDGSYNWEAIKEEIAKGYGVEVNGNSDDNSFSFTFTESSNPNGTSKPLTPAELGVILGGVTLTPVTNEDGTTSYTYKDTDGNTVTVQVNENTGTETSTTTWTVKVTPTEEGTQVDKVVTIGDPVWNIKDKTDAGELSVEEILGMIDVDNHTFNGESATITTDNKSGAITVEVGLDKYTITREEITETIPADPTADVATIFELLFKDKDDFTFDEKTNTIFKGNVAVTLKNKDDKFIATYYDITVIKTTQSGSTDNRNDVAQSVKDKASKEAIVKALNAALGKQEGDAGFLTYDDLNEKIQIDGDKWSVDGMDYTGTLSDVKATVTIGGKEVDISNPDVPLTNGSTINGSASATVTVKEEISGTLSDSNSDTGVSGITADDVKSAMENAENINNGNGNDVYFGTTGETIAKVTQGDSEVTIETTITTNGITTKKTYTFKLFHTYGPETSPDDLGHKWGDGKDCDKLPWDDTEKAWIFELRGANAFIVNQSTYTIICYDSSVYTQDDAEKILLPMFKNLDGGGNFQDWKIRYADINYILSHPKCSLGSLVNDSSGKVGAEIEINDGAVYIYGKEGKPDGLSHFLRGSFITATNTEVESTYTGNSSTHYNGNGIGADTVIVTPSTPVETGSGTASGVQYDGSLGYSYTTTQPGYEITVNGSTQTVREIHASLTSTTTTPGDNGGDNGGSDPTPPGDNGGNGGSDPTPPEQEIPDTNPPLVETPDDGTDIPDTEPPLVDAPEEEPPLVDVPEEEPPLVDIPDTETPTVTIPAQKVPLAKAPTPNTVEILEEDVPLAEVPETGESPMGLLAAAAACFSALGLGLLKKKHED